MKRLSWPRWMPIDPYILLLLGTVGLAALLPARGTGADVASGASTGAIAFLFFLYGARLSTREAMDGVRHWRLHVTVLACTFVVFPLLGLASRGLVLVFLTDPLPGPAASSPWSRRPSSRRSPSPPSPAATCAAAICAGSFSSLVGIVVTPLLAAALLGGSGGRVLRRLGGGDRAATAGALRGRAAAAPLDRGLRRPAQEGARGSSTAARSSWSSTRRSARAWSRASWHQVSPVRLAGLLAVEAVLLAVMLLLTWYGAKGLGFGRQDRIAIQFAGSKKSLAAGLPMAGVLFGAHACWRYCR